MGIENFSILNPYPEKPTLRVMEKSLVFNNDFKIWLEDNYVTVRINYNLKQVAVVKEKDNLPPEAIKPKEQKNSNLMRINSLSLANTFRKMFGVSDEKFTLNGNVDNDFIIFEKLS